MSLVTHDGTVIAPDGSSAPADDFKAWRDERCAAADRDFMITLVVGSIILAIWLCAGWSP